MVRHSTVKDNDNQVQTYDDYKDDVDVGHRYENSKGRWVELNTMVKACLARAESAALAGYDSIEIHLCEENYRHHFDRAAKVLYRKGWHAINSEGTKFVHYYNSVIGKSEDGKHEYVEV